MRYRLEDIQSFVAVVESGSISAAAIRLDLNKSVISKRVTALEECLGVALLQRSTRRASPTASGMEFFELSKRIIQELDEGAHALSARHRGLTGNVRLALPMSFGHLHVIPALMPFLEENKDLHVHMDLDDAHVDLIKGGYDLAIRVGVLADSSLVARRLTHSRRTLCCSPSYLAARERPKKIDELAGHDCIGYALTASSHIWRFQKLEEETPTTEVVATPVRARIVTNNGEAMVQAALNGLGLTILPTFLISGYLRSGQLIPLSLEGLVPTTDPVNAIYTQARNLPSKVRAIIEVLALAWEGDVPPWDKH